MNFLPQKPITMSNAEQVVNIEVEDIIEARLEESEALPVHIRTQFILLFHCVRYTVMELFPTTEKAGCIVTSSNDLFQSWEKLYCRNRSFFLETQ